MAENNNPLKDSTNVIVNILNRKDEEGPYSSPHDFLKRKREEKIYHETKKREEQLHYDMRDAVIAIKEQLMRDYDFFLKKRLEKDLIEYEMRKGEKNKEPLWSTNQSPSVHDVSANSNREDISKLKLAAIEKCKSILNALIIKIEKLTKNYQDSCNRVTELKERLIQNQQKVANILIQDSDVIMKSTEHAIKLPVSLPDKVKNLPNLDQYDLDQYKGFVEIDKFTIKEMLEKIGQILRKDTQPLLVNINELIRNEIEPHLKKSLNDAWFFIPLNQRDKIIDEHLKNTETQSILTDAIRGIINRNESILQILNDTHETEMSLNECKLKLNIDEQNLNNYRAEKQDLENKMADLNDIPDNSLSADELNSFMDFLNQSEEKFSEDDLPEQGETQRIFGDLDYIKLGVHNTLNEVDNCLKIKDPNEFKQKLGEIKDESNQLIHKIRESTEQLESEMNETIEHTKLNNNKNTI